MRFRLMILMAAVLLLSGGCVKSVETDYAAPDLGITLRAEDVTPAGMTLVCSQKGGEVTGELLTGSWYQLEKAGDGGWVPLEYIVEGDAVWDSVGIMVPMDDTAKWPVDWTWLYGEIPPGEYRLCKEFLDLREPGDYGRTLGYAEFTLKG